jgi:hypothetical protein
VYRLRRRTLRLLDKHRPASIRSVALGEPIRDDLLRRISRFDPVVDFIQEIEPRRSWPAETVLDARHQEEPDIVCRSMVVREDLFVVVREGK